MREPKPDPFAQRLLSAGRRVQLHAGLSWASEGDPLTELGYILDGTCTALRYMEDGDAVWIMQAGPGDFIGVSALSPKGTAHADYVIQDDVDMILITPAKLYALMSGNPDILSAITERATAQFVRISDHLTDQIGLPLRARISAALLAASLPVDGSPNVRVIRPNPVFVALAQRLHTSRESVSRLVSEMERQGILSRQTGAIVIEDVAALEAFK